MAVKMNVINNYYIDNIRKDILITIVSQTDFSDISKMRSVCKRWQKIIDTHCSEIICKKLIFSRYSSINDLVFSKHESWNQVLENIKSICNGKFSLNIAPHQTHKMNNAEYWIEKEVKGENLIIEGLSCKKLICGEGKAILQPNKGKKNLSIYDYDEESKTFGQRRQKIKTDAIVDILLPIFNGLLFVGIGQVNLGSSNGMDLPDFSAITQFSIWKGKDKMKLVKSEQIQINSIERIAYDGMNVYFSTQSNGSESNPVYEISFIKNVSNKSCVIN